MALTIIAEFDQGHGMDLAFSDRDDLWATAGRTGCHVWQDKRLLYSVPLNPPFGTGLRFAEDGEILFVGARILDLREHHFREVPLLGPSLIAGLPETSNARPQDFDVNGTAWSADGELLVVHAQYRTPRDSRVPKYSGPWKRLLLLDGRSSQLLAVLHETNTSEESTALDVSGRLIAAAGLSVRAWERSNHSRVAELEGFNVGFRDLRFSPDGSLLAGAAWDAHVAVWETLSWQSQGAWQAHDDYARCVGFQPGNTILASGGGDDRLNLWHLGDRIERHESLSVGSKVLALAYRPDGGMLGACLEDGRVILCSM